MTVTHRLGSDTVQLTTASGAVVAAHRRAVDGSGAVVRDAGHVVALEQAVLSGSRRPGLALIRPATALGGRRCRGRAAAWCPANDPAQKVVIDLAVYAATAARLSVVPQHHPTEQNQE
nr:hypothetical protein [Mycobacterium dioxanotrophicus]